MTEPLNDWLVGRAPFVGGQLAQYIDIWRNYGAPPHVLNTIQGYRIPFLSKPPLARTVSDRFCTPVSPIMTTEINKMVTQNILQPSDRNEAGFTSRLFLVPKSDGSVRPVMNLKGLNNYVDIQKFRLINVQRVHFIQPNDWLIKIDFLQAYFHIPISTTHRRFLKVVYGDGRILKMTCLPFGLASAPKAFARLSNWIAQLLRNIGFRVIVYLDDFLVANFSRTKLIAQCQTALKIFKELGFVVNFQKSIVEPVQTIEYLGLCWDTKESLICLPIKKIQNIRALILSTLHRGRWRTLDAQILLGKLNFASFAIPRGRLHCRQLQIQLKKMLRGNADTVYGLEPGSQLEMEWWLKNLKAARSIRPPEVTHFLVTDACDSGWGADLDGVLLSGKWLPAQRGLHSNCKEMLAILLVLQSCSHKIRNCGLHIQSDNSTVVTYLKKDGGTKSQKLQALTKRVLYLIDKFNIIHTVHYIPGPLNEIADSLSRQQPIPEWHILQPGTVRVFEKWGLPSIDLFASARAHVVTPYVTLDFRDKNALFHDAFSIRWNFKLAWVFPPPSLMHRVLKHLNDATGIYMIASPRWKRVFWRSDLKNRSIAAPLTIHRLSEVLIDTTTGRPPPKIQELVIEVWLCRGGSS